MKTIKFQSALAPIKSGITGGYGSGPNVNPGKWATELYGGEMSGPWLCCYMLRRFGWPNEGSDDYKNLCSWVITTPMPGLFLSVTPYLGHGGSPKEAAENAKFHCSNLHFGVRFNKAVRDKIEIDPGRERYAKRKRAWLVNWWKKTGQKLYTFGCTKRDDPAETLVHEYAEDNKRKGFVWGWYKRKPEHDKISQKNREAWLKNDMAIWFGLAYLIEKQHPEAKPPRMTKWEKSTRVNGFGKQVEKAIKATLSDLLKPTNVRDISFTPFGDIERTPEAVKRYTKQASVRYFVGAGNTPEYWYKHATPKERAGLT